MTPEGQAKRALEAEIKALEADKKKLKAQCDEYKAKIEGFEARYKKLRIELAQIAEALSVEDEGFADTLIDFADSPICKEALEEWRKEAS